MSFIKIGELVSLTADDIKSTDAVLAELDTAVLDQFTKTAAELKRIAPKAKDFLYFSAIFIHAGEASLIDDNGELKKNAKGDPVSAGWEVNAKTGSWKWVTKNTDILPYKNSNGDIFPEAELKIAYKKWIGKPLCCDHKSSSVDHIRGVIVDAYYDEKMKRVIGLCALDKVNYPDLARKVSTGYSSKLSMGTGVASVSCFSCGKVARVENDFCEHMKAKNSYGEINTGLSPIEVSLVVTPADSRCTVKSVIASANAISSYLDAKETLITNSSLGGADFSQLEKDLEKAQESLNKLKEGLSEFKEKEEEDDSEEEAESIKEDNNDAGVENMAETDLENTDRTFSAPARFAAENDLDSSDQKIIIAKLDDLEEKINNFINKLASIEKPNNFSEETDMVNEKKAYFQGAGDVNEPTPGKPKYPKEDSDSIRDKEDKQMLAQTTGPVDGLFPGDEAKKKELQRSAEVEQRALRRQAALNSAKEALKNKKAYFQGGGDVNEPTPGKPKYTKEDSDKTRDKEDKQMVGASPFPGVGKVDGLYGDDLKKKELLNRASLVARFIKAANSDGSDNLKNSGWHVYSKTEAGERLILTATVGDIAGDRAELMAGSIMTKEFGKNIINTIKTEGFDKAVVMIKGAQSTGLTPVGNSAPPAQPSKEEVDAAEGYAVLHNGAYPAEFVSKFPSYRAGMKTTAQAVPAMPSAGPGAPPDAAMTPELPADDKGNSGDPIDQVDSLIGEMDGLTADMKKAVDALKEEDTSDLDASAKPAATASVSPANMRKTLNGALQKGAKQAISEMHDHIEELNLIKHVHQKSATINKDDAEFVATVISDAISDAKTTTANVYKLMSAFVKYARGTDALIKKATEEAKMNKSAQDAPNPNEDWKKTVEDLKKANPGEIHSPPPQSLNPNGPKLPTLVDPKHPSLPSNEVPAIGEADDSNDAVTFEVNPDGKMTGTADKLSDVKADLNTPEGRAVMRAKIAQKGLKFSDMLGKAHPKGGVMVPGLDTKPSGDFAKVEDLEEIHDKMLGIAEQVTPKVRQAAEQIQRLVVAGRINPETDFDGLVAQGLDSAAVSYWKKFWGEAKDGGSQFASDLVKSVEKKKMAEEADKARVKTARAYELAHDMVEKGMIGSNREAITEQVNDIMTWNDASFESFKKVIASSKPQVKTAGLLPVVGSPRDSMLGGEDLVLPGVSNSNGDLKTLLESAFATSGRNKH
jgi:hypothetical protein